MMQWSKTSLLFCAVAFIACLSLIILFLNSVALPLEWATPPSFVQSDSTPVPLWVWALGNLKLANFTAACATQQMYSQMLPRMPGTILNTLANLGQCDLLVTTGAGTSVMLFCFLIANGNRNRGYGLAAFVKGGRHCSDRADNAKLACFQPFGRHSVV